MRQKAALWSFIFILSHTAFKLNLYPGVKVTPVASFNLLGGQYWVSDSAPASFGGNFDLFVTPVINFSPRYALLPIITSCYSGTKDVRELIGGGTMTRQMQDHALTLKFVGKPAGDWKVRARAGYKIEYLVETNDESWGKGLFDFNKIIGGAEVEHQFGELSAKLGADYYIMTYPNYISLVSQSEFESAIDTTTYLEISSQAGEKVLDYKATAIFAETAYRISENVSGKLHYDLSIKNFGDQKVVGHTGEFGADLRKDTVHYINFGISLSAPKAALSIYDAVQLYQSNQNSFDAANSQFTEKYYNFIQNSIIPSLTFYLGQGADPVKLTIFWDLTARMYGERLAQDEDGTYGDDKVSQVINTTGFDFRYPIAYSISAKFSGNYRDSASNMKYEKNYKYNYYTFNYFAGASWEY